MSVDDAFRKLMKTDAFQSIRAEVPAATATEAPEEEVLAPSGGEAPREEAPPVPEPEPEAAVPPLELSRIPTVPRFAHHPVDPRSQIAEEYRILRTRLQSLELPKPSVLLTSCHHNEGKTSTALNLALMMARRRGRKILLVDMDLRRPRLRRMLGLPLAEADVVSVLRGQCEPEAALIYSEEDNLYFLGAKREYASGTDYLEEQTTRNLIERLHASFDFVVIDSCPCLSTSDPSILGPYLGGAIMVIRSLRTQRESILHAITGLQEVGVSVIGIVMTFMRYLLPRYLYRYQYYQGYYAYQSYIDTPSPGHRDNGEENGVGLPPANPEASGPVENEAPPLESAADPGAAPPAVADAATEEPGDYHR